MYFSFIVKLKRKIRFKITVFPVSTKIERRSRFKINALTENKAGKPL